MLQHFLILLALIIVFQLGYGSFDRGCADESQCVDRETCQKLFLAGVYEQTEVSNRMSDVVTCDDDEVCCPIPKCGLRIIDMIQPKSIGGDETRDGEFPWMVAIFQQNDQDQFTYQCGGSLISPSVILTAAHCVENISFTRIKIRAGVHNIQDTDTPYLNISEIVSHSRFMKDGLLNDIALLILKNPLARRIHVNTICLPDANTNLDTTKCVAAGWGSSSPNEANYLLRKVDLLIVPNDICRDRIIEKTQYERFRLHGSFICAGGVEGVDTCKGDGGSPLMCPSMTNDKKYYQVGIVVGGVSCGESDVPGLYASVSNFREWIADELEKRDLYGVDFD